VHISFGNGPSANNNAGSKAFALETTGVGESAAGGCKFWAEQLKLKVFAKALRIISSKSYYVRSQRTSRTVWN
jgi:hypothetical protein